MTVGTMKIRDEALTIQRLRSKAQLAREWEDLGRSFPNDGSLFKGAALEIASIIRNNTYPKAWLKLKSRRERFRNMSVSGYYETASRQLKYILDNK